MDFKELPESDVRLASRFGLVFSVTTKAKRGAKWMEHSSVRLEDAYREAKRIAADHFEVALFDAGGFMYWSTRNIDVFNNTVNKRREAVLQMSGAGDDLPPSFTARAARGSPGGELYFDLTTGYELIAACRSGDFAIVCVEGFRLLDEGLMPKMDLIADFSALAAAPWAEFQEKGSRAARAFLDSIEDREVIVTFVTLRRAPTDE